MSNKNDYQKRNKHFQSSKKYFSISVYAIATFTICLIIFRFTNNWESTRKNIGNILSVFSPFLIAFLIAYFVNPLVQRIDKFLFGRMLKDTHKRFHLLLSMILSYVILIGGIILIIIFIVPQIISSISQFMRLLPYFYDNLMNLLDTLDRQFPSLDLSSLSNTFSDVFPDVMNMFKSFISDTVLPFLYSAGLSIIGWFINIILAFVISCYLLFSKQRLLMSMKRVAYAIFSKDTAHRLFKTLHECNMIFSHYIIGKTIDSLIIGIICFIAMLILKLPYALIISLIVGITNMIPYFGPFIGAIPGVAILLITDPMKSLIFLILIFAIQQLDGSFIGPKILGKSTGLQPISIIFAITAGGAIAGPLGMFLGVPIIAVLTYLFNKLIDYRLSKKKIAPDLSNTQDYEKPEIAVAEEFKEEFEDLLKTSDCFDSDKEHQH